MASKTSQNIRLGLFVLGGVVILIGFIFFIGANQSLFGSSTRIIAIFKNISGLQVGANVRFSGINVGTVDDIRIITDSTVEVTLLVDNKAARYVKTDSRVNIGSDGIMGDKVVSLSGGSQEKDRIKNGTKLASDEPLEFDAILAKASGMAENLNTITANMADMTNNIKQGKGTIGMLLYDEKTANATRQLLVGVNKSVSGLGANMDNLKVGTAAFSENMKAVQGNVLLRGYFKKKERAAQDSIEKVRAVSNKIFKAKQDSIIKAQARIDKENRRKEKEAKKAAKKNKSSAQPNDTGNKGTEGQPAAVNPNGQ